MGHAETVIDVPATLTARTRRLSGHSGRKTDEHDARLVAIAAGGDRRLRRVEPEDFSVVLGAARRSALASGVSSAQHDLSAACVARWTASQEAPSWVCRSLEAAKLLRSLHPVNVVDAERKQIARELVDWRWLHRRILAVTRGIRDALMAHGCTLTQVYGIGDIGAATIVSIVGDVRRFSTRGHFAAFNGHRAAGRFLW